MLPPCQKNLFFNLPSGKYYHTQSCPRNNNLSSSLSILITFNRENNFTANLHIVIKNNCWRILLHIEAKGRLGVPLPIAHNDRVLARIRRRTLQNIQTQPRPLRRDPVLHRLLPQLPAVLGPSDAGRRGVQLGLKGRGAAALRRKGHRIADKFGCGLLLAGDLDHEAARGEAFAYVVDGLAGVGPTVLGEDLVDDEAVEAAGALVLKVLARLDLLLAVQPDNVETPAAAADGARQCHGVAILHRGRLDVVNNARSCGQRRRSVGRWRSGRRRRTVYSGLLLHGQNGDAAGGLDAALGVVSAAGVLAPVLREDLVNGHTRGPVLVLDLHDLRGGDGLPILGPRDLGVGVAFDGDLELEPAAVAETEVGLEASEEGGRDHEVVVGQEGQLFGVAARAAAANRGRGVRSE